MRFQTLAFAATALLAAACAPVDAGDPTIIAPGDGGQCRADQYQRYVGRNRSELPARPAGEVWRVTCTTCPVTMDYQPGRLNILYEQSIGVIRQVKCG
jgi:hypothetical protein